MFLLHHTILFLKSKLRILRGVRGVVNNLFGLVGFKNRLEPDQAYMRGGYDGDFGPSMDPECGHFVLMSPKS